MRDYVAAIVALVLLFAAASLATTLQFYRRRRVEARRGEEALGRRVIAEIPAGADLQLFTEDEARFHYGEQSIDKDLIRAVRVLINGVPIATVAAPGRPASDAQRAAFEERPEGIERDRWDVEIEAENRTLLVPCGAIRERVSQELARKVFDAVKSAVGSGSSSRQERRGPL